MNAGFLSFISLFSWIVQYSKLDHAEVDHSSVLFLVQMPRTF